MARLSAFAFFLAPSVALLAMAGRSADKSRVMIICLSALLLSTVSVFAESYPNRPTAAGMDEYVAEGIICGNAVRERELAVSRSQNFLPYCGVWQPYIVSLQQELETLAPLYIDHENGPLTNTGIAFLYFTLDNWRAAADLNTNGFRRSVDGTTMLYGQMQVGDVIGPWIFEDLEKGFGALKWVPYINNLTSLKVAFPSDITGNAVLIASGGGVGWKGVYYTTWSGLLGSGGTYNLSMDSRALDDGGGYGGWNFAAIGMGYVGILWPTIVPAFELQIDHDEVTEDSQAYSMSLEFSDATVVFAGGVVWWLNQATHAISYSGSVSGKKISMAATLTKEQWAMCNAFPYCIVPFTNP